MIGKLIAQFFFISIFLSSGCIVYQPHQIPLPLFSQKNELQLALGRSLITGTSGSVAFAPTKNIGVQAYGIKYSDGDYYYQGALGLFWQNKKKLIFENYFGVGEGYGYGHEDYRGGFTEGDYKLYFTQFNIGQKNLPINRRYMDIGGGLKTGYFNTFLHSGINYTIRNNDEKQDRSLLIEPTFYAAVGGKFRVNATVSYCYLQRFTNEYRIIPFSQLNAGLGLQYTFKKKNKAAL